MLSFDAGLLAGIADVGAREARADQVDTLNLIPVDGGDVTEVQHVRVTVGEQLYSGRVVV